MKKLINRVLNNTTITKKILIILLSFVIILTSIAISNLFLSVRQSIILKRLLEIDLLKKEKDIKRLDKDLLISSFKVNLILNYIATNVEYSKIEEISQEINDIISSSEKSLDIFLNSKIYNEKEGKILKNIKELFSLFKQDTITAIDVSSSGDLGVAAIIIYNVNEDYKRISTELNKLLEIIQDEIKSLSKTHSHLNQVKSFIFLFSFAIAVVLTFLVTIFIYRNLKERINSFSSYMYSLSNGDFTTKMKIEGKDEIAIILSLIEELRKSLMNTLLIIKQISNKNLQNMISISEKMDNEEIMTKEITEEIKIINSRIIDQSAIVSEVSSTIEEITRTIESQDIKISSQSTSVSQSSSSIQEMIANIQSITNNLNTNALEFNKLEDLVKIGENNFKQLNENITELHKMAESVLEANNIIKNIASQTNILAMNASIEAAHAGEYGKGFSVVADEIRNLAENSSAQTKSISENINKLRNFINQTLSISTLLGNSFENIVKSVKLVSNMEAEIKHSIEEQASGSSQILEALTNIVQITDEINTGSKEMLNGSKAILDEIIRLVNITENVRDSSSKITDKIEKINEMIGVSSGLVKDGINDSQEMNDKISFFKIEE